MTVALGRHQDSTLLSLLTKMSLERLHINGSDAMCAGVPARTIHELWRL
jgi:hypothetical protein